MKTGLEVFLEREYRKYKGAILGLITNPSGVDRRLRSTIDLIYGHPELDLKLLFGPEHGVRGNWQAGVKVADTLDENTGLLVKSLYGSSKHLSPEMINGLDVIIYDLQDVGARYYTIIYTLAYALEGVKEAGKKMIVLDRPNPISPLDVAGNVIKDDYNSFVGGYRLPIVHGMTVGELAYYFNREFEIGAELEVVKMEGWDHGQWYEETGLPWVYPSPNMPTVETAILYPGTCLFEGTNLSEGRGTTKPFEIIGAPWISAGQWAKELNSRGLPGVVFRPVYFSPTFSKYQGEQLEGVQVHIMNRKEIDPVRIGITMLASAFKNFPESAWIDYDGEYFIDKLAGDDYLREGINQGYGYSEISKQWKEELTRFKKIREEYLLY
ncbi:MAG: hypothetical protein PWR10_2306 [Halanaerobiales bacterium]|nr:hypothetical protein [Halanaerobiales bacterium]